MLTALGRGTATTEVLDCLGLEATEKAVLLCMLPSRKGLLRKAAKDLWLDVPGRGVMMAVPVSSIGGASAKNYLLQGEAEDRMEKKLTHELIVVIANQGATDQVMDAAGRLGLPAARRSTQRGPERSWRRNSSACRWRRRRN